MRWAGVLSIVFLGGVLGCGSKPIPCECSDSLPTLIGSPSAPIAQSNNGTYAFDFGPAALGREIDVDLRLVNNGTSPLNVLAVGALSDAEFGLRFLPTSVQPGQTVSMPVSFKPFSVGTKSATVTIETDSIQIPTVTLTLTGTGVDAQLVATPADVDFGTVVVHSASSLAVTVTNDSTAEVTITPTQGWGSDSSPYSLDTTIFTLSPNTSKTVTVTYAPQVPTSSGVLDTASFALASSVDESVTVSLQGDAVQSGLQISPVPLDFNFVQPGESATRTLHVTNLGNKDVRISSTTISNAGTPQAAFSMAPQSVTLAFGQSLDLPVTFQPATHVYSPYIGQAEVLSDDNNPRIEVPLTGFGGGAAITCTPTALSFGTVAVNSIATLSVTCTNSGSDILFDDGDIDPQAELNFDPDRSPQTSSSAFAARFHLGNGNLSLEAGESTQIDVSYDPLAVGADTGTLTIVTNVVTPLVIALSGHGG